MANNLGDEGAEDRSILSVRNGTQVLLVGTVLGFFCLQRRSDDNVEAGSVSPERIRCSSPRLPDFSSPIGLS